MFTPKRTPFNLLQAKNSAKHVQFTDAMPQWVIKEGTLAERRTNQLSQFLFTVWHPIFMLKNTGFQSEPDSTPDVPINCARLHTHDCLLRNLIGQALQQRLLIGGEGQYNQFINLKRANNACFWGSPKVIVGRDLFFRTRRRWTTELRSVIAEHCRAAWTNSWGLLWRPKSRRRQQWSLQPKRL